MKTRRTKIVCSIGPACDNDETIREIILAGMNIARFNFSHGTYEWHQNAMERIRRISSELNVPVAIMLDTKGPEIRTGLIDGETQVEFKAGDKVEVVSDDSLCVNGNDSSPTHISISWKEASQKLQVGHKILIADGLIELDVNEISGEKILCTALNSGKIGSRKNVNLIGVHAGLPIMSEKDREDLKFGAKMDVDFVAASFVSFPGEIIEIRNYMKEIGLDAKIIAKIENQEGLSNINEIVAESDGIMVARGDLGVQLPVERIPLAQKEIIKACHEGGKPVITATQMLDSMIVNPRPTRAELTDVSNAIFDGTDAVMLSGETASGKYPVDSVKTMALIALTTENSSEYMDHMRRIDLETKISGNENFAVAHCAYELARNIGAKAILTPTSRGVTARMLSEFRPEQTIIAVTPSQKVQRQLLANWGIIPLLGETVTDTKLMIGNALKKALDSGEIEKNDKIVLCAGVPLGSALTTNTIQMLTV